MYDVIKSEGKMTHVASGFEISGKTVVVITFSCQMVSSMELIQSFLFISSVLPLNWIENCVLVKISLCFKDSFVVEKITFYVMWRNL